MSSPVRIALAVFVGVWLFTCALDAVAYLHVPNPLDWRPGARGMVFIESVLLAVCGYAFAKGMRS
jgi:hypothetical protein